MAYSVWVACHSMVFGRHLISGIGEMQDAAETFFNMLDVTSSSDGDLKCAD